MIELPPQLKRLFQEKPVRITPPQGVILLYEIDWLGSIGSVALGVGPSSEKGLHHINGVAIPCRILQGGPSILGPSLNVGPGTEKSLYHSRGVAMVCRRVQGNPSILPP